VFYNGQYQFFLLVLGKYLPIREREAMNIKYFLKYLLAILILLPIFPAKVAATYTIQEPPIQSFETFAKELFQRLNIPELNYEAFAQAYKGYLNLENEGMLKKHILTVIDFSKSSKTDRLFIIDMDSVRLTHKSLVAHGKNSGEEFATAFSNTASSSQSSLGFYLTGETYTGKHGFSLRLDGLDLTNNNARSRAVVMHKADYVSKDFITKNGRLGRSHGCPAIPNELNEPIIELIKGGSCLYIYHPAYNNNSRYLLKDPELVQQMVSENW
jgi:hypothetical protein